MTTTTASKDEAGTPIPYDQIFRARVTIEGAGTIPSILGSAEAHAFGYHLIIASGRAEEMKKELMFAAQDDAPGEFDWVIAITPGTDETEIVVQGTWTGVLYWDETA